MTHSSRVSRPLTAAALLLIGPALAWAHHGWGGYNSDVDTRLVVTELHLGGAHDQLVATDTRVTGVMFRTSGPERLVRPMKALESE